MSDLDLHVTQLKTVGGVLRVYEFGSVPAAPAAPYCVVSLDSGTPSTYSLDSSSDSLRLLSVQMFGQSTDAIDDMTARADVAFRDRALTYLPGSPISNRVRGTTPNRDPDGEVLLYVLHVYRYQED